MPMWTGQNATLENGGENLDGSFPDFEIAGPTIDDDIRRLVRRYGVESVRHAIRRQAARPLGRVPKSDWPKLGEILREDAHLWLKGGDPFKVRSNRSIARAFAEKFVDHSYDATHDRMMRKLRQRRRYYTLVEAEWISQTQYPYAENLRAIRELQRMGIRRDLWERLLSHNEGSLTDYTKKFGEPANTMTMQELTAQAATPITAKASPSAANVLQILVDIAPE